MAATVGAVTLHAALESAKYIDLVTYKRNGSRVATPVWFAIDSTDRLVVYSEYNAGKVKRVRNNPVVEIAPCNAKGKRSGTQFKGTAVVMDASDGPEVDRLLTAKYGWLKRIMSFFSKVQRTVKRQVTPQHSYLAITVDA